jgi:hypothetical protein
MSNTIAGISNAISGSHPPPARGARPDLSKVADVVFGKLDSGNKGYLDKADLQSAVDQVASAKKSGSGSSSASADDLLKAFDGNGDGKITKQEFSDGTKKLAEQFENQFNRSRTSFDVASGAPSGPPPHAAPGAATGAGGPASAASANSATSYAAADTNQDGTVSEPERIAYEISNAYINSHPASEPAQAGNGNNEDAINRTQQILHFLQSYAQNTNAFSVSQSGSIDVSA